ncbi:MAG TPA: cytochrome C [Bacteroidales bacterium]|nr:cytochrome C [Bacteroidales bacterium]
MKKLIYLVLIVFSFQATLFASPDQEASLENQHKLKLINYVKKADRLNQKVVDHGKFAVLQQEFKRPQDVTLACLSCHTERHTEIMANNHWTWQRTEKLNGRGEVSVGKKNILNNFCIGTSSNRESCTRCHIGYGWKDESFDFTEKENIDCLVCHDLSGVYKKESGMAGYPVEGINLNVVAQSVGSPKRANCGVCHFWGGGGNNVKHGDLEEAMNNGTKKLDVHMGTDGEDMSCIECHITENHNITGKLYALSSENKNRISCEQCHTTEPHSDALLNKHGLRIACQTCHIPYYAKANSTKMWWDWTSAGRLDEHGEPLHEADADGNHNYLSIKGTFVWDQNIKPSYFWFNGLADHFLITDSITEIPIQMNTLNGAYSDKGANCKTTGCSKIWPVKVHRGKQPYDAINNRLVQVKTFSKVKGEGAYWMDFDWNAAIKAGMEYVGLPYSGEYGFVETEMYWPLNHQVSPASQSLRCIDCHTRSEEGRLASLTDFYLPGRDYNAWIDNIGIILIILSFIGVVVHGALRIILRKNCLHD